MVPRMLLQDPASWLVSEQGELQGGQCRNVVQTRMLSSKGRSGANYIRN